LTTQPRIGGLLGTALAVVGILLALFGGVLVGTASLRILPIISWDQIDPTELVTTGVYGFVRHPIYAGLVLMYVGWSLGRGAVYALFLSPFFYLSLRFEAWLEERVWLRPKFGDAFEAYRAWVPTFFPLWLWAIWIALLAVIVFSVVTGLIPWR
jgi:protein-S-isoprenylcysteine O-methyltransferase Ste14